MIEFLSFTFIGLLAIVSPGPDFAVVTKNSLQKGRKAGIFSAIGISIANLCHVALNLLGIGIIISQSLLAFTIMKILGAGYLLYIGYKGLRSKQQDIIPESHDMSNGSQSTAGSGFLSGFLTSVLNPKACLFYLSFFSVILSAKTPLHVQLFYGFWLSSIACVWFVLVAVFFTHPMLSLKIKKSKHWIERITGGALMLLGLRLLGTQGAF